MALAPEKGISMRLGLRGAIVAAVLCSGVAAAQVNPPTHGAPPPQVGPVHIQNDRAVIQMPRAGAGDGLYVASADRVGLSGDTRVVAVSLPRGAYQIIGHVVFANDRNDNGAVACALRTNAAELDYISTSVPPNTRDEHTLLGAADLEGGPLQGAVYVSCSSTSNVAVTVRWARLQALVVSHITGQITAPSH